MTPKKVKVGTKEVTDEKKAAEQKAKEQTGAQASQPVSPTTENSDPNVVF